MTLRTWAEINAKIQAKQAVVWTAAALKARVKEWGVARCARTVDVITTGTFEPMEASGAVLNLGQTDPPIKLRQCWLDGVPCYTGFGAVDVVIGASQLGEEEGSERGGGHVIADLIAGNHGCPQGGGAKYGLLSPPNLRNPD
jgi:uncharacterized protein (DUF39 family)